MDNHFFGDNFSMNLRSKTCCQSCFRKVEHIEKLFIVPIPFTPNAEISESLEIFFEAGVFQSLCSGCNYRSSVKKQLEITKLPKILIFQLQKAENLNIFHRFPSENLSLDNFCEKKSNCFYNLYAVCIYRAYAHNTGHYYSYVKKSNNKWYKFNDDREIHEISLKEIYEDHVYLLFYEQVEKENRLMQK